ncbi:aldehyde dehydrogenase family protein [Chroococcidiopsis thermalis]|uniref:Aldehyde dehydrogenase n=1 Tax=Chroococcidiopsis thermalis (strain PCC 7203) TaxID=251229 RepID=K9U9E1_CHRTP|nr:aldehyde dehydrogenase family protein [Chroococcidiopsis thermalis]AFY90859.1 Aldehyde Dehydrogenase [Chroococcidiopsis thermalis PCC 7203]PSB44009.1 aldehyde dehydrogenase family protein [Cyanosarcina cf. burmensis CCALA 770]
MNYSELLRQQREFFQTGKTRSIDFRLAQLKILKQAIVEYEIAINEALQADLHKPVVEIYLTEITVVKKEIDYAIKHLKSWIKPHKAAVPLEQLPGAGKIYPEPLGIVLIISPWNYPLQLAITPLVGAIAAGNCTIIKPSEIATHAAAVLAKMLQKYFDSTYISVVEGGVETSQKLLTEKFDHIFFTGGTNVGRIVMEAAAKHLTPVVLELGGKSPCIVDTDINLEYAAKRITWGKFINAGQSCIAPDYLLVPEAIKQQFIEKIQKCIAEFYGAQPANSPDYGRIIDRKQFDRLVALLADGKIVFGGETDAESRYIAPTVIELASLDVPAMQSEIFGPILPVVTYQHISEAIAIVNQGSKPLALYLFSRDRNLQKRVLAETSSGSACINDTVLQFVVPTLPFGGVGSSGMGKYHGKASFDIFSHYKSVLYRSLAIEINLRYPPYRGKLPLLKRILG